MLISHRKKFIFTKTAKTAGTSVESFFEEFCMPEGVWTESHQREEHVSEAGIVGYRGPQSQARRWFNHMPALTIRSAIGDEVWTSYFKFTTVRNPFTKLVSVYLNLVRPAAGDAVPAIDGFRRWVAQGDILIDRDKYLIDGAPCVDYFIRFEALGDGIREVCRRLDITKEIDALPRFKQRKDGESVRVDDFYDTAARRKVERVYAWELDNLGYGFPS